MKDHFLEYQISFCFTVEFFSRQKPTRIDSYNPLTGWWLNWEECWSHASKTWIYRALYLLTKRWGLLTFALPHYPWVCCNWDKSGENGCWTRFTVEMQVDNGKANVQQAWQWHNKMLIIFSNLRYCVFLSIQAHD